MKERLSGLWLALAAFLLDRITKAAMPREGSLDVLPGLLRLRYTRNTGMAFSMLSRFPGLLTFLTLALSAGIAAWLIARPASQRRLERAGLWLVCGGGLGNALDRVLYGGVTDFIEPLFVDFAVFNVADICVCAGVALTVAGILFSKEK